MLALAVSFVVSVSFAAATVAALLNGAAQLSLLVMPLIPMVMVCGAARVAQEQERVCGLEPLIAQPVTAESSAQVTPAGSGSFNVTLLSEPEPVTFTVTVNVAVSAALTGPLPVLVTVTSAQLTVTVARSEVAAAPLVGVALAVLVSGPHVCGVELAVT